MTTKIGRGATSAARPAGVAIVDAHALISGYFVILGMIPIFPLI
jgi:hypothetical protein